MPSQILRKTLATIFVCMLLSACGAHYGAALIVSEPPGAEVINTEDNTVVGITPITHYWKDGSGTRQYIALRLKLDGHYEKISSFWLSMRHKTQSDAIESAQLVEVAMDKKGE